MGYLTSYQLDIIQGNPDIIKELRSECEDAEGAIDEYGETYETCTWYTHEKDLKAFSSKHPNALFLLEGEGEESADFWKKYFKNGKCFTTKAKLVFEEYDESKLQ